MALLGIGSEQEDLDRLTDVLAGHTPSFGGQIRVGGEDVTHRPTGQRGLATLGAHAPLFPHLTLADNILFPLRASERVSTAEAERRTTETLSLVGLDGYRAFKPGRLTAEQNLRGQLARALVMRPEVLVLNRPFSTLDHTATTRMLALLEKLQRAIGLSILLLTRDRTEALMAGDSIGIMDNGILLQLATPPDLLNRPAHEQVAIAFGEANVLTGKVLYAEDDMAELRLPTGETVDAMAGPGLEEQDLANICVSPDRISVMFPRQTTTQQPEDNDMLLCTLVSARHVGAAIHMRFRMRDGGEIIAHRPPVHTLRELEPGRVALLAWQTANATAFPMDQKSG
ncbi:spermidine/putrescine transporter ATP-binding protein [Acetobacter orleanensis NRIC 0473]|nr:spermidine/putrescine transporter ATP-binding protein [Acetobacter orleanensis NRIC 0473]